MKNITSGLRIREIIGSKARTEAREILEEIISRLDKIKKLGLPESLGDDLVRAVMVNDEHEIYSNITTIQHRQMGYITGNPEPLSDLEKQNIKDLKELLINFLKDPDYIWLIETDEETIKLMEDDSSSGSLADLLEQYDEEMFARYADELEYDGYSTD